MVSSDSNTNRIAVNADFVTTRWSQIVAAGLDSSAESERALAHLCRTYWYPLYAYIRRSGRSPHDAEDLTQGFFAHLLAKNVFQDVEKGRGKFRSFLLASLKNFLANAWDKQHSLKRGGKYTIVSFDDIDESAEDRYRREPSHDTTPERLFEQGWALTVIETVLRQLRREYVGESKVELFEALQERLIGAEDAESYAELAAKLGTPEGTLRMTVLRMRRHFGYLLRTEIAHTVENPAEIEDELRHLIASAA
jgi:RNA polymerase sigma factor (sigma-70 family)